MHTYYSQINKKHYNSNRPLPKYFSMTFVYDSCVSEPQFAEHAVVVR
jgi:hypothetical protein